METKEKPKGKPNGNQGPPRGVRFLDRPERPNPFGVQWPEFVVDAAGQRERKKRTLFFKNAADRDAKAAELARDRANGRVQPGQSRAEVEDWKAMLATFAGVPWQTIYGNHLAFLSLSGTVTCTVTIKDAYATYLTRADGKLERGTLSKGHHAHVKQILGALAEEFGHLRLDQPTKAQLEQWIAKFGHSPTTFDNYRKHLRSFFNYFVAEKVLKENPADRIERRAKRNETVEFLTVAQTAQLLHTCLHTAKFKPMLGRLAMECFIGMRYTGASRLQKTWVNRADRGVEVPVKSSEDARRRYVTNLPETLWLWYDLTPDECWQLTERQYLELKSELFEVAQVPHPHNCLRHGFATNHLAAFGDAGKSATIMVHQGLSVFYRNYAGKTTAEQGKLFWTLTPATAAKLAKGFEPAAAATTPSAPPPTQA